MSAPCPQCGRNNWNDLGCITCGLEFFPPSEAYWDASGTTVSERAEMLWEDRGPASDDVPAADPVQAAAEQDLWNRHCFIWRAPCSGAHDKNCGDPVSGDCALSRACQDAGFKPVPDWKDPAYRHWLILALGTGWPPRLTADVPARPGQKQLRAPGQRPPADGTPLPVSASFIEHQFWDARKRLALPELAGLVPQYQAGRFRLDFALPELMIGIELDGFRDHSTTEDIAQDCLRQRWLQANGWRVIRYGGKEVYRNAESCVRNVAYFARKWAGEGS